MKYSTIIAALALGFVAGQDACAGDVAVKTSDELSKVAQCTQLKSLTIDSAEALDVKFGALTTAGKISIKGDKIKSVSFDVLSKADEISLDSIKVESIKFPVGVKSLKAFTLQNSGVKTIEGLETADEAKITLKNNDELTKLGLKAAKVDSISIDGAKALASFDVISALTSVTNDILISGSALKKIEIAALTKSGAIVITKNAELTEVKLPEIATVSGKNLTVSENPKMETIELPKLTKVDGTVKLGDPEKVKTIKLNPNVEWKDSAILKTESVCKDFKFEKKQKFVAEGCKNNGFVLATSFVAAAVASGLYLL